MNKMVMKVTMVVLILLSLGLAYAIYHQLTKSAVIQSVDEIVLKCANPNCDYEKGITREEFRIWVRRDFEKFMQANPSRRLTEEQKQELLLRDLGSKRTGLGLTCPECGQETVFKAIQCEKCRKIFFPGAKKGAVYDKCPECGFSKIEQKKNK